jgi:hypothetical protein
MPTAFKFRRLLAATTALAIVLPPWLAVAQDDAATPAARVGDIAGISGDVSFSGAGTGGWAQAEPNYPVSSGDVVYTQPDGQAVLALDASTITLAGSTELQINGLTDSTLGATAAQGEVFLDIENLPPGETYSIATPRGTATIAQDGKYDIAAGDQATPTVVSVFAGAATVTAAGATVEITAGQAAALTGTDQIAASLGQAQPDAFAQAALARAVPPPPEDAPPVVSEMTGGYRLAQYGSWDQDSQYGAVWYPRVDAGWAPYRDGHWADVPPWGYTWVDDAPWGFAPFHYGRWIDHDGRWGWVPADPDAGAHYRPVYAPALVTFFGIGAVGVTIGALSGHSIGWVPLGPGEVFRPYYRASEDYDRRVNRYAVRDADHIRFGDAGDQSPAHFANRRGATYMDGGGLSRGEQVARFGHPARQDVFATARPLGASSELPRAAAPLAHLHPGQAPHPGAFAARHEITAPQMGRPAINQPGFGANPAYHPPPRPPGFGDNQRPQPLPRVYDQGGDAARPPQGRPPLPQVYRPEDQGLPPLRPLQAQHQQLPQVYQPQDHIGQAARPDFHPQNAPRPPLPPVFHPQAPPRPPETPFHPQFQPPPEVRALPAPQPHLNQPQELRPPPPGHGNKPDRE